MANLKKIGFGGGCHWCTEAVFSFLKGVTKVEQGWIASEAPADSFSEAVIVHFNPKIITVNDLVAIHLHTHDCTSDHSMRAKYRSAVYYFDKEHKTVLSEILTDLQADFEKAIITQILPFHTFKASPSEYQDYYRQNPKKPFCQTYINPKLNKLREKYGQLLVERH
ncbi:peptide methionine sulfoxide reductase [Fulvivirga sp. RKSG066]|uniref:peptide-methionine (S)-S-oxide reductase n=1 Tax=Fulvivirga aurantia TaxID=2529383 RepID=UPI0012BD0DA8|nr:peptide-methionine (S)-S-oxide reductase [Fulvivirga aurantia]MTI22566.1 peptide methionine sulfoxide reductase [Fulvivirga aurantia]